MQRIKAFRSRERGLRITAGVAMVALAVGLAFNLPQMLQRLLPDYTSTIQQGLVDSKQGEALGLGGLVTDENRQLDKCTNDAPQLQSCGAAPQLRGIQQWLNTPGGAPVDLASLRGKVVLIDFWAYSCINCQRSIPHVVAWDKDYKSSGLEVIGVHSPEYAFEKDPGNVAAGVRDFGIHYPVALDNSLSTWTNYRNRYWPAHYLIDAKGVVRHISFGEGDYATTERLIRELLTQADPGVRLPTSTEVADTTPAVGSTTPETFLGATKAQNFGGSDPYRAGTTSFSLPADQAADTFALQGPWNVESQDATPAGDGASVRLRYHARDVRMVLSGSGEITVQTDAGAPQTIRVDGTPRSYSLRQDESSRAATLTVTVPSGVDVYSFTFG